MGTKFRDFIRSKTKNSDGYVEKYMKIKLNLKDRNETVEIPSMTIVARAIFLKNSKYYSQVFFR